MLINSKIANQKSIPFQSFGRSSKPDFLLSQNNSTNPVKDETNLNNTPSVQNKVIIQSTLPYKKMETFEVPNVGKGYMYQLQNGHKVIILPKQGTTNIYTHIKVGSYDEPDRLKGISHLLEHLESPEELKKSGIISNATTSSEQTYYYMKFSNDSDEELERSIQTQSKILSNPDFSVEDIEKEKEIVISEINFRKKQDFDCERLKLSFDNLYGKGNIDLNVSGDENSVKNITKEDLLEHHKKFYTPENSVTTIVGDVDPDKTIKIVSKYFNVPKRPTGAWESNSYPNYSYALQIPKRVDIISPYNEENKDPSTSVTIDFAGPSDLKESYGASILADVMNKTYFDKLNTQNDSFSSLSYLYVDDKKNSPVIFSFESSFKESQDKNGLKTIYSDFYEAINTPIDEKTFEKVKKAKKDRISYNENSEMLASFLGQQVVLGFSPNCIKDELDIVETITKKDIEALKIKYLDLNKASVIVTHPKSKTKNVSFGKNTQINMDYIKQYELDNNMIVVVDNSPGISQTNLNIVLESPDELSQNSATGLVLAAMLKKGMSNDIDGTSTDFDSFGTKELHVMVYCDEDKIIPSIKEIKQAILNPTFTQDDLDKSKKRIKEPLEIISRPRADRKEDELYGDTKFKKMYEQIDYVTLEDVKKLHKQIIANAQGHVVITSPTKDANIPKILQEFSQDIPQLKKHRRIEPEKIKSLDKSYVIVDKWNRDSNQALIRQSYKTFYDGNAKDYVATALLYGLINDRAEDDLRETQGIVYTPISKWEKGRLSIEAETDVLNNPENIQKVIESFDKAAKDLSETPISDEELAKVKRRFKIAFLSTIEPSSNKNTQISDGLNTNYGINALNEELQALDDIKPEHIQRAAKMIFAQHSVTSITAPKEAIEVNKNYLKSKGELIQINK